MWSFSTWWTSVEVEILYASERDCSRGNSLCMHGKLKDGKNEIQLPESTGIIDDSRSSWFKDTLSSKSFQPFSAIASAPPPSSFTFRRLGPIIVGRHPSFEPWKRTELGWTGSSFGFRLYMSIKRNKYIYIYYCILIIRLYIHLLFIHKNGDFQVPAVNSVHLFLWNWKMIFFFFGTIFQVPALGLFCDGSKGPSHWTWRYMVRLGDSQRIIKFQPVVG